MQAKTEEQHKWLHKFVGDWTFEVDADMGPDKPRSKFAGAESARLIGEVWMMAEGRGEMPGGGTSHSVMTLGFDPQKQRFVGTWIGSPIAYLWLYDGALDAAKKVLTLEAEGPSMAGDGKMTKYKDVVEFKSDDHRVLSSAMLREDGTWHSFMIANYYRKK